MTISAYDRNPEHQWEFIRFNINTFKSSEEYVEKIINENESKSNTFRDSTLYKEIFQKRKLQEKKTYSRLSELEQTLKNFDNLYDQIDMGGAFKKNKLNITDDKRGIFSFGLASKGLYRGVEYFSEEIKIDNPTELIKYKKTIGVVPANLVKKELILGEIKFCYTSETTNKLYFLTRQQEGTADVLNANPNAILKQTDGGLKYPEPQSFNDVSVKFKTSTKKSYLMFDKKGGKAKMVELYIPIHDSYKLNEALPVFLIAKYLTSVGIKVKISAIRMYFENSYDYFFMWSIPIKDYGDEMDFNKMSLVGIDDDWWKIVRVGVKTLEAKKGNWVNGAGAQAGNMADYVEAFARYRNWYDEQIKLGLIEPLRVDKKLIMIAGLINRDFRKSYEQQVMEEFYRIMDRIDFFFNKTDKVVDRIYKREVEKKSEEYFLDALKNGIDYNIAMSDTEIYKNNSISDMKRYVQQVLSDTFTYPIGGEFAESQESADFLEEEFDKKLEEMNNYLKTL
jgi:hypothetical protein